jgi:hydroxymethylglutaryl-CoA lyase
VEDTLFWLKDIGVKSVSLADTAGTANTEQVGAVYRAVKGCVAGIELGVHLHSRPEDAAAKVAAAYEAGCRRFDGALTGLGGCPFAGDDLVGNIPTETVLGSLAARGVSTGITTTALEPVLKLTQRIRREFSTAEVIQ